MKLDILALFLSTVAKKSENLGQAGIRENENLHNPLGVLHKKFLHQSTIFDRSLLLW